MIQIVKQIKIRSKYIVAKGGITSNDIGIKGLGMKKPTTIGQVLPGVLVWKTGLETRFPNIGYVVFPGNIGNENSLTKLIQKLK